MNLGPITEVRFRDAFSAGALITAKAAASLLGLDVDTLSEMASRGAIRAVPRGRLRSYSEAALRAFLLDTHDVHALDARPTEKASKRASRSNRVMPFTKRPGPRAARQGG